MGERHDGTGNVLLARLREALSDLPEADCQETLELIFHELERVSGQPTIADARALGRALRGDEWYAIHASDLELLKSVGGAVAAFLLTATPITAVGSLVVLLYRYRKHRIKLAPAQGLVLRELKRAGSDGLVLEDLRYKADLASLGPSGVTDTLEQLRSIPKENGQLTSLVSLHGGRWRAENV